ncbi:hypothetical protein INR49_026414 [Caranx melampygus]|nr:hypothetical protein INR49_026414 [Caranx melampygus]
MVDLFLNRVLVENNWDQDELNTEREITGILENRILMLFFASAECEKCQEFVPVLNDFFKRLKDPAYIEYPKLLALIYISLDQSEEQQERVLNEMHKRVLFLAFEDPYRKELQAMFKVKDIPTVVVLRPDGSILSPNTVQDICHFGSDCFRDWQESAELIERSFMLNEEFENLNLHSATDPVRRLKYKKEDDKRKRRWWQLWGKEKNGNEGEEERDGAHAPLVAAFIHMHNTCEHFMSPVPLSPCLSIPPSQTEEGRWSTETQRKRERSATGIKNNKDQDELDTEREIVMRLENRILMLFFASAECEKCQEFAPTLTDFFKRLTDEFYVDRSAQLVLLYISLDESEDQQEAFLKELPKKCLFLAYEDPYRRELEAMFNVEELPTVVVLRPDCSILTPNAVGEILCLGPDCYRNWQEASELINRNFMISEEFEQKSMRSFTDPVRRLKYKVEDERKKKKKKKKKHRGWGGGGDAEEDGEADGKEEGGGGGSW